MGQPEKQVTRVDVERLLHKRLDRYRGEAAIHMEQGDIEEAVRLERAGNIVGSILHEIAALSEDEGEGKRCGGEGALREPDGRLGEDCPGCPDCKPDTEGCTWPTCGCDAPCGRPKPGPDPIPDSRKRNATDQSHSTPQPSEEPQMRPNDPTDGAKQTDNALRNRLIEAGRGEWPEELQVVVDEHGVSEIYWGEDDPPPPEDSPRTYVPLARLEAVEAERDRYSEFADINAAERETARDQRDTLIERLREIAQRIDICRHDTCLNALELKIEAIVLQALKDIGADERSNNDG